MYGRNLTEQGQREGLGMRFRGSSPPWPYVGQGRGGLPRCGYYFGHQAGVPVQSVTRKQEINLLKSQAENIKKELEMVESMIHNLETIK